MRRQEPGGGVMRVRWGRRSGARSDGVGGVWCHAIKGVAWGDRGSDLVSNMCV